MKYLLPVLLVGILVIGAFYAFNTYIYEEKQADLTAYTYGSYPYMCANGVRFELLPSEDMNTVYIRPVENDRAPRAILSAVPVSEGVRYEADGITLIGRGESVELSTDTETFSCAPVVSQENAPLNFGD